MWSQRIFVWLEGLLPKHNRSHQGRHIHEKKFQRSERYGSSNEGKINPAIHVCLKLCLQIAGSQQKLKAVFSTHFDFIDIDKDGIISLDEYKLYCRCLGLEESEAIVGFDAIDANKDGTISREEFIAASLDYIYGFDETSPSRYMYGRKGA